MTTSSRKIFVKVLCRDHSNAEKFIAPQARNGRAFPRITDRTDAAKQTCHCGHEPVVALSRSLASSSADERIGFSILITKSWSPSCPETAKTKPWPPPFPSCSKAPALLAAARASANFSAVAIWRGSSYALLNITRYIVSSLLKYLSLPQALEMRASNTRLTYWDNSGLRRLQVCTR